MGCKLLACFMTAALALTACGDDDGDDAAGTATTGAEDEATTTTTAEVTTTEATTTEPAEEPGAEAVVQTGQTDLGEVLTTADGLTLYGFTNDAGGNPTCEADCAQTWPPLTVESSELPPGLDAEVFSVVQRPDGTSQLAAGAWPLYLFSGDAAPGDTNGQGVAGVWYVVTPTGELAQDS